MFRILIAECKHEVSTFNPVLSGYEDFQVRWGDEVFDYHSKVREEVGGALQVLGEKGGCTCIPTYSAKSITSGGTLRGSDFRRIASEFLDSLRVARRVDGAFFALHGAMAAETEDDPEGFLLQEARSILGERIPIVASIDLHGIVTARMLRYSDAIVPFHTYPHVDFYQTGARAAEVLLRVLWDGIKPVTARVKLPMLARGDELITETGSFGEVIRQAQAFEARPLGLAAGVTIGNPFTDVPSLRSNSLAVAVGSEELARACAERLAGMMWRRREGMQASLVSVGEAIRRADAVDGTAVLMDAADATSSGASGDSNVILRQAVRDGFEGRILAPIVDPRAVEAAFAAGEGQTVLTTVGGAIDPRRFFPMQIHARVKALSDGAIRSESFGLEWSAGRTAVLAYGQHVLVVTSRPVSLYDRSLFLAHGQDPREFDLVVVKSPHCEPHMYRDWCRILLNVDALGSTSANLASLGHMRCDRPVYPLDEDVEPVPVVEVYRHGSS